MLRYFEFFKWCFFKEFDGDFIDIIDFKKCNWEYLIFDFKKINGLILIVVFESYKCDFLKFVNYLVEFDLESFENKIKSG